VHLDLTGAPDAAMVGLSTKQAQLVSDYLKAQGLGPDRVSVVGVGRARPAIKKPGAPQNSRVEVIVLAF
jgi:outer membrane protein OmpA-like peptidoglycan-associated protein